MSVNETAKTDAGRGRVLERRHRRVALVCGAVVLSMTGAAFAAVPLYRLFCQATGYAGTTQRAAAPSTAPLDGTITVRFDANTRQIPWDFTPVERTKNVRIGENTLAFFRAVNTSPQPVKGTATFNVTPEIAGAYFFKIECFCFQEQLLEPGQSMDMPVSFYVDPAILDDRDARKLSAITLSYTFYPVAGPAKGPLVEDARETTRTGG